MTLTFARAEALAGALGEAFDAALPSGARAPEAQAALRALGDQLQLAFGECGGAPVELRMRMSLFVQGGRTLANGSIRGRSAIAFLRVLGAGGLRFTPVAGQDSLRGLAEAAREVVELRGGGEVSIGAAERACEALAGVELLPPGDHLRWSLVAEPETLSAYAAAGIHPQRIEVVKLGIVEAIEEAVEIASSEGALDLDRAREVSERILDAAEDGFADVLHAAERPEFDVFTVQHSLRVSLLASYVATRLGVPREALIELTAAAMFHDVGKGRIPEEVLYKPGRLDEDEARLMRTHPRLGAEILLDSRNVSPMALGAAWGHHVRYDGRGYPDTRRWFEPSRATSLIQVCDVFEALTANRPYKPAYSPARAYRILYSDPGAFDPGVLAAFTRAMGLYPPGRFVALEDGRLGRVAQAGQALDRPVLRLFPDGQVLDLGHPEHGALGVAELLDEPEALRRLRGEDHGHEAAPEAPAPAAPRDEEFFELAAPVEPDAVCGHGAECRLC